jgi:hypothetical protein
MSEAQRTPEGGNRPQKPGPKHQDLRRNDTSFPVLMTTKLKALFVEFQAAKAEGERDASVLKYYQYLVRAVMSRPEYGIGELGNGRGLLIYHAMGMGKTLLAIALSLAMFPTRRPLVALPKALQKNFSSSVAKATRLLNPGLRGAELDALIAKNQAKFQYVSLNAHNMPTQIAKATSGIDGTGTLTGRLLIVDEAHTLFRAIINSGSDKSNARRLYNMVMTAKNLRILFLTGTPCGKNPFEMVPCFNMLTGTELLPTQYESFYEAYVTEDRLKLKNRNKLANRILGLVSHVSPMRKSTPDAGENAATRSDGGFPELLAPRIERVEMSPGQYARYLTAREKEDAEKAGSGGQGFVKGPARKSPTLSLPGADSGSGSTYHYNSRTLSNYTPPVEHGTAFVVKDLPDDAFGPESSPKAARLLANIEKSPGPVLVYSQFVEGGLGVVARYLQLAGYREFGTSGGGEADLSKAVDQALRTARQKGCRVSRELASAIRSAVAAAPPHELVVDASAPETLEYVETKGMCRFDHLMNMHNGQRKLFLSELQAMTRFLPDATAPAVVVYAGAAGGDHIPFLASLFPNTEFHLYDPASFAFEGDDHPRLHTYTQFFTDETAASWKDRCDVFVSDIRVGSSDLRKHEMNIEKDMAAQARWARLIMPRGGAVMKYRPPYWAGDSDRDSVFPYLRGEICWQMWGPATTTEARLFSTRADLLGPDTMHDGTAHQNRCFYHAMVVRPWLRYPILFPHDAHGGEDSRSLGNVQGFDHCYDCVGEAKIWHRYFQMPGAVAKLGKAPQNSIEGSIHHLNHATCLRGAPRTLVGRRWGNWSFHGVAPHLSGPAAVQNAVQRCRTAKKKVAGGGRQDRDNRGAPTKYFAVVSGDVPAEVRDQIVRAYNSPQNAHGEVISVLLVSSVGAMGLDLRGVRQVHKFEPYWYKSQEDQVDARATRAGSHDHLPHEERDVQTFLYLATPNRQMYEAMQPTEDEKKGPKQASPMEVESIDESLHRRALAKESLNQDAMALMRECSIECAANEYGNCRMCVPNGIRLFGADPMRDLRLGDPCTPLEEKEVEAQPFVFDDGDGDAEYFARDDPAAMFDTRFYRYDTSLEAHVPIDPSTPLFHALLVAYDKAH